MAFSNAKLTWLNINCLLFLSITLFMASPPLSAEETVSATARGGRLYDKWWAVNDVRRPRGEHPAYPADGQYKGKDASDWRCKECHGWDYSGKDGAYGKGKHFTGIGGIRAAAGADPANIMATLQDTVHAYSKEMLSEQDLRDLALFVSQGQVDMNRYIDAASKAIKGDVAKGEPLYNTLCANCHGQDGARDKEGHRIRKNREPLGKLANDNPWETLHKILNGQPDELMPPLRALDTQIAVDILAYLQNLPQETPEK